MQDNFNLAKYLRHGNKLLNESVGGYVDLKPINSLNEAPMGDDIMTLELDMAWDFTNPEEDAAAKAAFDKYGIEVKETDGNPGTFEVTGRKEDILAYLKSDFYGMEYVDIATYYPELLDEDKDSMSLEELMGTAMEIEELEKPEQIYADDEDRYTGSLAPSDDRMMDLGGDQIEQGIISLLDDGFEPEDILDACKMLIATHSQGKKF
jgi:hypothetical protein